MGLIGVSGPTVYFWETGKTRPRPERMAKRITIRGLRRHRSLSYRYVKRLGMAQCLGGAKLPLF
jgi:hypothetical protein